jgi:hypothetical protein
MHNIRHRLGLIERMAKESLTQLDSTLTDGGIINIQDKLTILEYRINQLEENIMMNLDQLRAAVERNRMVDESAVTLIRGIKMKLDEAIAGGMAEVQALSAELENSTNALAEAVTANTPVEEPPVEPTEPPVEPTE